MMAPKVAVPIPSRVKPPTFSLKLPAPSTSATATVIRLRGFEKSTRFSTQIRPAAAAMRPKTTIDRPPSTETGIVWMSAPNFGENPSRIAMHAGAAEEARQHGRDPIAHEAAAEVGIEVAPRHGADRLDMPEVLGDENHRNRRD